MKLPTALNFRNFINFCLVWSVSWSMEWEKIGVLSVDCTPKYILDWSADCTPNKTGVPNTLIISTGKGEKYRYGI